MPSSQLCKPSSPLLSLLQTHPMSCLNLGKGLLPARKAWKSFTTKLQNKLHKLQRSKGIKKKTPYRKQSIKRNKYGISTALLRPSISFQRKKQLKQPPSKAKALSVRCHRSHAVVQKRAAAVYVDELFKDSIHAQAGGSWKRMKVVDEAGASRRDGKARSEEKALAAADDMWESLGLASPLMYGIDERAEEFIARFRADLARGL